MKGSNYRLTRLTTVFDAQAEDTVSANIKVKHFDILMVQVATAELTDGTFKIRGTVDPAVVLSDAKSPSNIWDHKHSYNLDDPGSGVPGDTGYAFSGEQYAELKINVDNGMEFVAFEIVDMTAGAYTVKLKGVNIYGS